MCQRAKWIIEMYIGIWKENKRKKKILLWGSLAEPQMSLISLGRWGLKYSVNVFYAKE